MLSVEGGSDAVVWIDGEQRLFEKGRSIPLEAGRGAVEVEVRWLVAEPTRQPLRVVLQDDNRSSPVSWRWTHNQRDWEPFINKVSPDKVDSDGGTLITIDGVGFLSPQTAQRINLVFIRNNIRYGDRVDSSGNVPGVVGWSGIRIEYRTPPAPVNQIADVQLVLFPPQPSAPWDSKPSNAKRIVYKSGGSFDRIAFQGLKKVVDLWSQITGGHRGREGPRSFSGTFTTGVWAQDGRTLVMGTIPGLLATASFMSTDEVDKSSIKVYDTLQKEFPGHSISGIEFDPLRPPSDPHLYVAHGPFFYWWRQGIYCFNETMTYAPFLARISRLSGPDFSVLETVLENLPISNTQHTVNGLHFDNEGNLYANVGSTTNAGWPACWTGGLPESPLSASLIKVEVNNPNLTKKIEYVDHKTREPIEKPNQLEGDRYDLANSVVGVTVWSSGLRNAYDSVYTTKGRTYVIMNGPNIRSGSPVVGPPSGDRCTPADFDTWDKTFEDGVPNPLFLPKPEKENGRNCQPILSNQGVETMDRIFNSFNGAYHGHPNPARARNTNDTRQWYHFKGSQGMAKLNFTAGRPLPSPTTGISEFRGSCFNKQLQGSLLVSRWQKEIFLVPDEENIEARTESLGLFRDHLDIQYGPACSIVLMGYESGSLSVLIPEESSLDAFEKEATSPRVFDVLPWRGPMSSELPITLGGRRFTKGKKERRPETVLFGGIEAAIQRYDSTRIEVVIPAEAKRADDQSLKNLVDVVVHFSDGTSDTLANAFLFLKS
uniref:Uncharacterized protein n=1 Tax=Vitrella brassicaformis TaxID=1169539 RepID=A0A6U4I7I3_9ALVE|mmetsp:Transcript_46967/g.117085  ORF Transcript_46967/g.117085 Transcript_46967/m.117085 type:complete len:768 (+) Transcript_46967:1124-3427(+)